MDDELKNKVKELYQASFNKGVRNLTFGCFLDNNCDITKCRKEGYNPWHKEHHECCTYYEKN
jgi:hypothetical protein